MSKLFLFHAFLQNAVSFVVLENSINYRHHIWKAFFFIDRCNMSIHERCLRTGVVTDVVFEWLFSYMNPCIIWFHITFCRTPVVANVTFERVFPSWTDSTCIFKVIFRKQQKSHLIGFFLTWTETTCVFKFLFWE